MVFAGQVGAVGLAVWARRSFEPGTFRATAAPVGPSIIRRGPYRFIRHPMYSAALILVWSATIGNVTTLTVSLGTAVAVVIVLRVLSEERLLCAECPEYLDYRRSTKALVPFVL